MNMLSRLPGPWPSLMCFSTKVLGASLTVAMTSGAGLPIVAEEVRHFSIAETDAVTAIEEFSQQSGIDIGVSGGKLAGRLHAVYGDLSVNDGLTQLLAGTGLTARYVGSRAVALVA